MGNNFGTFFKKNPTTRFVVRNIAYGNKTVKVFNFPILNGKTRDLLDIPGVSEADIRHSLLKGELLIKCKQSEILVQDSDIDLLQFNDDQKSFLQSVGIIKGLEVTTGVSQGLTEEQHLTLRQLIHLADGVGGPMEGFASGAYRETLPFGNPFPTTIVWWDSDAKLKKIVEKNITRNGRQDPIELKWKVYDSDGSLLAIVTDTIEYTGPFETSRTRTVT